MSTILAARRGQSSDLGDTMVDTVQALTLG
jgi:hypothetical protein